MVGEELTQAAVDARGILGDRLYAVRDTDGKLGGGRDSRRFRRMDGLLDFRAAYLSDLTPVITLPDGRTVRGDEEHVHWAVSDALDQPGVTLVKEGVISHFDQESLHLVTTANMDRLSEQAAESDVDARRVRPNLVIQLAEAAERPENSWVGHSLHIGNHLVIDVVDTVERCAMVNATQQDLADSTEILRAIGEGTSLLFGVYGRVAMAGRVRVGDDVLLS